MFVDFRKAHDSIYRDSLYNLLMEFGVQMNLTVLKRICLEETQY